MASEAELPKNGRTEVRIPGEVVDRLDFIVDSLNSGILEAACQRARARKNKSNTNRVTEEDILHSAIAVLRSTASKLEQILNQRDAPHVRVRNAS